MSEINVIDTQSLGVAIRERRQALGLRQPDLAFSANVGIRFIVDIENGKESCQVGLVLRLLNALGLRLRLENPAVQTNPSENDEIAIDNEPKGSGL